MYKTFLTILAGITACCFSCTIQNVCAKDTLVMKGKKSYNGTFQSYKNEKFCFLPDSGKTVNELRAFAERLTIDPPSKVTVTPKGKKKIEDMKLKGYEKSNFVFEKAGKEITMPGMYVSSIEMGMDINRSAGGDTDVDTANKPLRINLTELSDWMKEGESSPEQKKAFEHYKSARETYNKFVAENAAMVKTMDATKGPAREEVLNKLRKRKNDEQPLLGELKKSEQELLTAFPEMKGPAGNN